MNLSSHKTGKLLLVALAAACLAANGVCAAQGATAHGAHKPSSHPPARSIHHAGTAHATAGKGGTPHGTAHSTAGRRTAHRSGSSRYAAKRRAVHASGSAHHTARRTTPSHKSSASVVRRAPGRASVHSSRRNVSAARRRHHRSSSRQRLARLHLQPERVREIQEALIREGYLQGPATGQWDSNTRGAMLRFQTAHGFPTSGLPEAKSLMKLGLGSHPLPPELDRGKVATGSPSAAQGSLDAPSAGPPVSQAMPLTEDASSPQSK